MTGLEKELKELGPLQLAYYIEASGLYFSSTRMEFARKLPRSYPDSFNALLIALISTEAIAEHYDVLHHAKNIWKNKSLFQPKEKES